MLIENDLFMKCHEGNFNVMFSHLMYECFLVHVNIATLLFSDTAHGFPGDFHVSVQGWKCDSFYDRLLI
jgi:hypothetical protein